MLRERVLRVMHEQVHVYDGNVQAATSCSSTAPSAPGAYAEVVMRVFPCVSPTRAHMSTHIDVQRRQQINTNLLAYKVAVHGPKAVAGPGKGTAGGGGGSGKGAARGRRATAELPGRPGPATCLPACPQSLL